MPNAPAARVTDQVLHSEAKTFRRIGMGLGALAGIGIGAFLVVASGAVEVLSAGTLTPVAALGVYVGAALVVGGTAAATGGMVSNSAADMGKSHKEEDGPILTGVTSIHVGPDRHVAAHAGSKVACKRHKHNAPDDVELVAQGSSTVLLGPGHDPAARIGDLGTCKFSIGQGCTSVIIGGKTTTRYKIVDGDDPEKALFNEISKYGGYAALIGGALIAIPVAAAGSSLLVGLRAGAVALGKGLAISQGIGWAVNQIPNEELRDHVNTVVALALPFVGHGEGEAEETPAGGGDSPAGGDPPTPANDNVPAAANDNVPGSGGPPEPANDNTPGGGEPPEPANDNEPGGTGDAAPSGETAEQIGTNEGGAPGVAPADEPVEAPAEAPADEPMEAAGAADPVVQTSDSPGGLRAAEDGARPDLSPEENFPGQQSGNNCAPQSCQQIIRQATGKNYTEAEMSDMAEGTGAYDPAVGTTAGGEADILSAGGVPAHTEAQTPENIQNALDNGQGVVTGHDAATLWEGDPNYQADPDNPVQGGHAVHTTGLVRDADGNVTHYVINDTGTGTSNRMVPADQFHQSLDTGPAAVTDDPIRTPAAATDAVPAADDAPTAPEGTTAPRAASSRGDPVSEGGESQGTREEDTAKAEDAPSVPANTTGTEPQGVEPQGTEPQGVENAGAGDPTVQTGDRPGGLEGGEEEGSAETTPDDTASQTKTPEQTAQENYDKAVQAKGKLPKNSSYRTKVTASNGTADFMSGTGSMSAPLPEGYGRTPVSDVRSRADEIGHTFPENQVLDNGDPGSHYASHAEVQAFVSDVGARTGVMENMCGSCQEYYRSEATALGETQYNADPTGVWKFQPDGTISRPDGETINPDDTIRPSGIVDRADGSVLKLIPRAPKP